MTMTQSQSFRKIGSIEITQKMILAFGFLRLSLFVQKTMRDIMQLMRLVLLVIMMWRTGWMP